MRTGGESGGDCPVLARRVGDEGGDSIFPTLRLTTPRRKTCQWGDPGAARRMGHPAPCQFETGLGGYLGRSAGLMYLMRRTSFPISL